MQDCYNIIEIVYDKIHCGIDKDELISNKEIYIREFLDDLDLDEKITESIDWFVSNNSQKKNKTIIKKVYSISIFDAIKLYERNGYGTYFELCGDDEEEMFYAKLAYGVILDNIYENLSEFKDELINYIKINELNEDDEDEDEEDDDEEN